MRTSEQSITMRVGAAEVVSVPMAAQSFIVMGDKVCAIASQPAIVHLTGPSVSLSAPSLGTEALSAGESDVTRQVAGPPPPLFDELLFRLCKIGMSYDLTKDEMIAAYLKTLALIDELNGKNFDAGILEQILLKEANPKTKQSR